MSFLEIVLKIGQSPGAVAVTVALGPSFTKVIALLIDTVKNVSGRIHRSHLSWRKNRSYHADLYEKYVILRGLNDSHKEIVIRRWIDPDQTVLPIQEDLFEAHFELAEKGILKKNALNQFRVVDMYAKCIEKFGPDSVRMPRM